MSDGNHRKYGQEWYDRVKVICLAIVLFCVMGSHVVMVDLRSCVFAFTVGQKYIPLARFFSMILLVPAIAIYSRLVNALEHYKLLCVYSIVYALFGFVFAYYVGHSVVGIANLDSGPYRYFGWIFYFFMEVLHPFIVSIVWAFVNSINSPESAQDNYGWITVGAKFGGLLITGLAWCLLSLTDFTGGPLLSDIISYRLILIGASFLLCIVPAIIIGMMHYIPLRYLHGYEAAYQVELHKKGNQSIITSLTVLSTNRYVMGMLALKVLYGVSSTVLGYLSVGAAQSKACTLSQALRYLIEIHFFTQIAGFLLSIFGAGVLFKHVTFRHNLMIVPCAMGAAFLFLLYEMHSPYSIAVAVVIIRSVYLALSRPLTEILYTPTADSVKFKSRMVIDTFGSKCARFVGSVFNIIVHGLDRDPFFAAHALLFFMITVAWVGIAFFLGKKFEQATTAREVIGLDGQ